MAETNLTDRGEGKHVVNSRGDKIGMVTKVHDNTAFVDPDPRLIDAISSKLGWGDVDEEYELQHDRIETVTDDKIRLTELAISRPPLFSHSTSYISVSTSETPWQLSKPRLKSPQ